MPQVILAIPAAVAGFTVTIGPAVIPVGQIALQAVIAIGLNAYARSQLPEPASGNIPRKQTRPIRTTCMGLPSRFAGAFTEAGQ